MKKIVYNRNFQDERVEPIWICDEKVETEISIFTGIG